MNKEIVKREIERRRSKNACINCIHFKSIWTNRGNFYSNDAHCRKDEYKTKIFKITKGIKKLQDNDIFNDCCDSFKSKYK